MTTEPYPLIDDRSHGDLKSNLGTRWQFIADTVMGGVSRGELVAEVIDGRPCLHLTGQVSLANNGGFVQAGLDLRPAGLLDARRWSGIELEVRGNGETYNLHLRTVETRIVWQSYRASFVAGPQWTQVRLPFDTFQPHEIDRPLDLSVLRRLGLVAIGREMTADLCLSRIAFYMKRTRVGADGSAGCQGIRSEPMRPRERRRMGRAQRCPSDDRGAA